MFKGVVIGITGSAGKTTLKENLKFYLQKKYKISSSIKSYNNNLGVLLSISNMDLKSKFALFEIGTNNFGEIKLLSQLVQPSQLFITNILSTHLENFKTQRNIALEKSDIFNKKYNPSSKVLFFSNNSKQENLIYKISRKQKLQKIITIGNKLQDSYIKKISYKNNKFQIDLTVLGKQFSISMKEYEEHRIVNILFILSFFIINKINPKFILNNIKILMVEGRGSRHQFKINGKIIKFIDESYNANPETMTQSIINFSK